MKLYCSCKTRRDATRGYVLLMVMVLLVVMATALTTIATRSLQTSQEAIVAATQLQQRIGIASCQAAFLPKATIIFNKLDEMERASGIRRKEPRHMVAESILLSDQRFDVVLSDENAKVNLNTMYHKVGLQKTNQKLRDEVTANDFRSLRLTPAVKPNVDNTARAKAAERKANSTTGSNSQTSDAELLERTPIEVEALPACRSWGEVFSFEKLMAQNPDKQIRLEFTKSLTLWGSGQVNMKHANDKTLQTVIELVLTRAKAKKMVEKIREADSGDVQTMLELDESISPANKKALASLLGTYSYAYSMFIDVATLQGRSRKLFVQAVDANGIQQISEFVFH